MERLIIKGLLIGMVIFSSCYYDVEEILYPPTACETANMSLQFNIEPILDRNCYTCHSTIAAPANGNIILEGYDELIKYAISGQLVGAIHHDSEYEPMPQNAPKMGNCDISKITQWVADGALNN